MSYEKRDSAKNVIFKFNTIKSNIYSIFTHIIQLSLDVIVLILWSKFVYILCRYLFIL